LMPSFGPAKTCEDALAIQAEPSASCDQNVAIVEGVGQLRQALIGRGEASYRSAGHFMSSAS
jgi:hypothetical protein